MSEADAIEAAARALLPGMSVDQAARTAYAAIAPIVRRDVAEAVLALHRIRENHLTCAYDDEIWPCETAHAVGVTE